MTKSEIIYSFKQLGISLPTTGKTELLDLKPIKYLTFTKLENKFIGPEIKYVFDMTDEQIECYSYGPNGKLLSYPGTQKPRIDIFDFESLMVISSKYAEA